MVEDESSWLRMANKPAVLASYWPLLTALGLQRKQQRKCLLPWISAGNKSSVIQCSVHHKLCAKKLL